MKVQCFRWDGQPQNRADLEERQRKRRVGACGQGRWGRVRVFRKRESGQDTKTLLGGRWGGTSGHVGNSNVAGTTNGSIIVQVT